MAQGGDASVLLKLLDFAETEVTALPPRNFLLSDSSFVDDDDDDDDDEEEEVEGEDEGEKYATSATVSANATVAPGCFNCLPARRRADATPNDPNDPPSTPPAACAVAVDSDDDDGVVVVVAVWNPAP